MNRINNAKQFIGVILAFCMVVGIIFGRMSVVCADYQEGANKTDGEFHEVPVSGYDSSVRIEKNVDISEEVLSSILAEVRDRDKAQVSVLYYGMNYSGRCPSGKSCSVNPKGKKAKYIFKRKVLEKQVSNVQFLSSLAKGMSGSLDKVFEVEGRAEFNDEHMESQEMINFAKQCVLSDSYEIYRDEIYKGYPLTGPDEDQPYNSRNYYLGIETEKGCITIWENNPDGKKNAQKLYYTVPKRLVIWTVDRQIQ